MVWVLLNVVAEKSCWQQRERIDLHGHIFLDDDFFFSSCKIFVIMGGICANDFFRLVLFLKSIMGGVLKAFYKFDVPVIGAVVLLEYLLDLLTLDYILRIKLYMVYHDVFAGEAVVFDWAGQLSEFAVWQIFFVSFISKLFYRFSRVTVLVFECWTYLSNLKCLTLGNEYRYSDFALESFDGYLIFAKEHSIVYFVDI